MNTVVSLITPRLKSAVAIIRVSGPDTYNILNKIVAKPIAKPQTPTINKNRIVDTNQEIVDDVLLMMFFSPKSFTGEDVIEINCHGNLLIIDKIINLCLKHGANLAKRGEFTRQAFLNNKLDIIQANSINSLINSNLEITNKISLNGILGKHTLLLQDIKQELFTIIGNAEVSIDYPEYEDIIHHSKKNIEQTLTKIKKILLKTIKSFDKYKYIYNGINVLIVGKTNSGKSSLFNAILNDERSIVSSEKGTTRDYISESVIIDNLKFNFIDTAGFNKNSKSKIEKQGISKINSLFSKADVIIYLIDTSKKISQDEMNYIKKIDQKKLVLVKNKSDKVDKNPDLKAIEISAKNKKISKLISYLKKHFKVVDTNDIISISTNEELAIFNEIVEIINQILDSIHEKNFTIDLILPYIENIYHHILILLGEDKDFDLLDKIFANFCLGK